MEQEPLGKCKQCQFLKVRKDAGTFGDGKTRRYVDRNGKQWCGLLCPECQREKAKNTMSKLRRSRKYSPKKFLKKEGEQ